MPDPIVSIEPLGDSAINIRWKNCSDIELVDCIRNVAARLNSLLDQNHFAVVPAFATLTVHYDACLFDWAAAERCVLEIIETSESLRSNESRLIEIPVCYDECFAPDLRVVAQTTALSPEEVIKTHAAGEYSVRMIGFSPGFPYLSGLPEVLHCPRKAAPRPSVAAGSVAIGGTQTGIYPHSTPGGWQIIGRTPLRLFDLSRPEAGLLRAGDRVRFFPIDLRALDAWSEQP